MSVEEKRGLVELGHEHLSIRRQCNLLSLCRSSLYYEAARESEENLMLMRLLDEQYMKTPFYGSRRMAAWLGTQGYLVSRKRVQSLMQTMGLAGLCPKHNTSKKREESKIYPYLLQGLEINQPNQVWCSDITYIPMKKGFFYLVVVMDWHSRYVLSWELSNTLDVGFCLNALERAMASATPHIFNTDQGSQYTSLAFTQRLLDANVRISMDGKGRCFDNIFIERLWRTVKYEDIYLKEYHDGHELWRGLAAYFDFYNNRRVHQSLAYQCPAQVFFCA